MNTNNILYRNEYTIQVDFTKIALFNQLISHAILEMWTSSKRYPTKTPVQHKIPFKDSCLLYLGTFSQIERHEFIAFLKYWLGSYCRWSEQRRRGGGWGIEPPDRSTMETSGALAEWKGLDKSLRRECFLGLPLVGPRACAHATRPRSWWATGAQLCVVHYHTQRAATTTPLSMGRRMPSLWLSQTLAKKAWETKAPVPLGEAIENKGHRNKFA